MGNYSFALGRELTRPLFAIYILYIVPLIKTCILALIAFSLCACGSDTIEECETLATVNASIEVGTGATEFTPIGPETGFELGPQGGWHVYASIRTMGLYPGILGEFDETAPKITYRLNNEAGEMVGGFDEVPKPMRNLGDNAAEIIGEFAVLAFDDASLAEGLPVTIIAKVEDACGKLVETSTKTVLSESAM